jgi:hypothetical protein
MEHRLPENHLCPLSPTRAPLGAALTHKDPSSLTKPKNKRKKFLSEGNLHFVRNPSYKPEKRKILPIAAVILAVTLSLIAIYFAYTHGVEKAFLTAQQQEYDRGFIQGKDIGYSEGYAEGVVDGAGTGYNIRNPTYAEMQVFINSDTTNLKAYSESYTCFNFVNDVKTNAFNSGYKAGMVYIEFADGAHAIVCFDTTDRGLMFVEPQTDDIVSLRVGGAYDFIEEPNTVLSYTIIW